MHVLRCTSWYVLRTTYKLYRSPLLSPGQAFKLSYIGARLDMYCILPTSFIGHLSSYGQAFKLSYTYYLSMKISWYVLRSTYELYRSSLLYWPGLLTFIHVADRYYLLKCMFWFCCVLPTTFIGASYPLLTIPFNFHVVEKYFELFEPLYHYRNWPSNLYWCHCFAHVGVLECFFADITEDYGRWI